MANQDEKKLTPEQIERIWWSYLTSGTSPEGYKRPWYRDKQFAPLYRHLPANPRCRVCHTPFAGIGGVLMRYGFGIVPSRLNPQMCNVCELFAERYHGGAEIEMTILFADVRGSTHLAETMTPGNFSRLINRFYNAATSVIFKTGGMVEKLIGDAVTGFFTPGQAGQDHARVAVEVARDILKATGHGSPSGPWISVGIGVHTGIAYVGSVNADSGITDIAVLGDAPNTGARLGSLAAPGEILVSQATARAAGLDPSQAQIRQQVLKGKAEAIEVWAVK